MKQFETFIIHNGLTVWLIISKLCCSWLYFINYTMQSYRDSDWQNYKQTVITFTSKIPFAAIGHRTGFHLQSIILKVFIIHALQLKCFWTCGMKIHWAVYVSDHLASELQCYKQQTIIHTSNIYRSWLLFIEQIFIFKAYLKIIHR